MANAEDWRGPGSRCPACRSETSWSVVDGSVVWACNARSGRGCETFWTWITQMELGGDELGTPVRGLSRTTWSEPLPEATSQGLLPWDSSLTGGDR